MERLWAPWRMDYIAKGYSNSCFLCEKCQDQNEEKDLVLFKSERIVVLLNLFPYNNGHLLVAPCRHVPGPEELSPDEALEFWQVLNRSLSVLKAALNPEGFNIGANLGKVAGAGLDSHFHLHVVPRWLGDTNFMPVLAEVKVMPEHLSTTYHKLKEYFLKF
ncbi:MAG: HIT family protein [bacterium]